MEEVSVIPGGSGATTTTTTATTTTNPIREEPTVVKSKGKGLKKGRKRKRAGDETLGPPFRTKVGATIQKRLIVQDSRTHSSISWLGKEPKRVLSEEG